MSEYIKRVHVVIDHLARFRRQNDETIEQYCQALADCVKNARHVLNESDLDRLIDHQNRASLQLVYGGLYSLSKLSASSHEDPIDSLISFQQQSRIKVLLQLIFSLGFHPTLEQGVNLPLALKTKQLGLDLKENWTLIESYEFQLYGIRALMKLLKSTNVRSLILGHLGDILGVLLQVKYICNCKNLKKLSELPAGSAALLSEEGRALFKRHEAEIKEAYSSLLCGTYKPWLIRDLMILMTRYKTKKESAPLPAWLNRMISNQLTNLLVTPGGAAQTLRAFVPSDSENVDSNKVRTIAHLMANVCHHLQSQEAFYSIMGPQFVALLSTTGSYNIPVAKCCIKLLFTKDANLCQKYIFDPMFEPLIRCSQPVNECFTGVLIAEDSLTRCVSNVVACFSPGGPETSIPLTALKKILKLLFLLFKCDKTGPSGKEVETLLIRYLHAESDLTQLSIVYNCLLFDEPCEDILEMNPELSFECGPNKAVRLVRRPSSQDVICFKRFAAMGVSCQIMMDTISNNEEYAKELLADLLVYLLSFLVEFLVNKKKGTYDIPEVSVSAAHGYLILQKNAKMIFTSKLLADLSENPVVMLNLNELSDMIVKLVVGLLENYLKDLKDGVSKEEDDKFVSLVVPLRIIGTMTQNLKVGSKEWESYTPLLEPLKALKDKLSADCTRAVCVQTYESILTQGAGVTSRQDSAPNAGNGKSKKKKAKSLDATIDLINDQDIPTRGHGLIELVKLIKKQDPQALARKEELLVLITQCITHDDSYVYLQAINAMVALGCSNPDLVYEYLCDSFMAEAKEGDERLKVGEALVGITRRLGTLSSKNKKRLINTFLLGAKSEDQFLRASSLANLGSVFEHFQYTIHEYIYEVFVCLECIITTDKSSMARRAAALVAECLAKGYTAERRFEGLETILKNFYSVMKIAASNDSDEVVQTHANSTIRVLQDFLKSQLIVELPLEKKISILGFQH